MQKIIPQKCNKSLKAPSQSNILVIDYQISYRGNLEGAINNLKNDIRKMFYEQGQSISEIARQTVHDRKTVGQYVNQTDWNLAAKDKSAAGRPSKIDPYKAVIDSWLTEDKRARKK